MKTLLFCLFVVVTMFGWFCEPVWADNAALSWTANTEADLAGYKIYRGQTPAVCSATATLPPLLVNGAPAQVGLVNSFVDQNLPAIDGTLCWEISAVDSAANESGRSNRVSKVLNNFPPQAPAGLGVVIQ